MKYIIMKVSLGCRNVQEMPIIFPEWLTHADMETHVKHQIFRNDNIRWEETVSAGFVDFHNNKPSCSGASESLKIKSRLDYDNAIIKNYTQTGWSKI